MAMLKLGQKIITERGDGAIELLNQHPYPCDPYPYVYIVALDGGWADYVKQTSLYVNPSRDFSTVAYCPECDAEVEHEDEHARQEQPSFDTYWGGDPGGTIWTCNTIDY